MKQLMKWLICNQHEVLFLLLLLSSNAFSKSDEYYKAVIVSGVFDCNTKCKEHKLQYEIMDLSQKIMDLSQKIMHRVLQELGREIDKQYKSVLK